MNRIQTILIIWCCLAISAAAQADRASLPGNRHGCLRSGDTSSSVELTDTATGFHRDAMTGEAGSYSVGTLAAGAYKATFSRASFQTVQYDSLSLLVGENRTLNVQLPIGNVTQEAHVEA